MDDVDRDAPTLSSKDRLHFAEYALSLLHEGKLPHLKNFIFGAQVDFRRVQDAGILDAEVPDSALKEASVPSGTVKLSYTGSSHFTVFYEEPSCPFSAELQARCFGEIARLTYRAIGLDLPGELPKMPENAAE